jgi:hypothetical protein
MGYDPIGLLPVSHGVPSFGFAHHDYILHRRGRGVNYFVEKVRHVFRES